MKEGMAAAQHATRFVSTHSKEDMAAAQHATRAVRTHLKEDVAAVQHATRVCTHLKKDVAAVLGALKAGMASTGCRVAGRSEREYTHEKRETKPTRLRVGVKCHGPHC